jgi:hypothetical protein
MIARIYYGDGSVFEGGPEDAPTENVQCIAWDDPTRGTGDIGRIVLSEWDMYIYSDDIGWHGTDKYFDLIQHLQKGCGPGGVRAVVTGRWISWADFTAIKHRAQTDPDLRQKSANRPVFEVGRQ